MKTDGYWSVAWSDQEVAKFEAKYGNDWRMHPVVQRLRWKRAVWYPGHA